MTRNLILLLLCGTAVQAQNITAPLDGVEHKFLDETMDHLTGSWNLTGQILGHPVTHRVTAEWTLNHQFLHFHEKDTANPPAYEVEVYIGYDNMSERYVAHWLDVFGGRFSETLGFGKRDGNSIRFLFEYPDGQFTNTFHWKPAEKTGNLCWRPRALTANGPTSPPWISFPIQSSAVTRFIGHSSFSNEAVVNRCYSSESDLQICKKRSRLRPQKRG